MNKKETRFSKLNNCLGYGNPNGTIIFIGIEESRSWELKKLFPNGRKDIQKRLNDISRLSVEEQIGKVLSEFNLDLEYMADKLIDDLTEEEIYVPPAEVKYEYSTTTRAQSILSFEVLKLLGVLNEETDFTKYERQTFGSRSGKEICLNHYPISRSESKANYPEEEYFFGTNAKRKFYSESYESERIGKFKMLFQNLKQRMKKEDIFLFLLGNGPYTKLSDIIGEVFEFDFGKNYNDGKFRLTDDAMLSNRERNIWSVNHPSARPRVLPLTEKNVHEFVIPEIKKFFLSRKK